MEHVSLAHAAALGLAFGAAAAAGAMGAYALRTAAAITRGHRWPVVREFFGSGTKILQDK